VRAVLTAGGADILLLDNMVRLTAAGAVDTSLLEEAVRLIDGRLVTEASGNVTLATVPAIAATGVDYISSGALTHSVEALDIALKIDIQRV
jgi:nicotinate-nucleotide pyrophosphorylase (carboxylating)